MFSCSLAVDFPPLVTLPDVTIVTPLSSTSVAKIVGDLNGDNIDDVIISEFFDTNAWMIFGSPSYTRNSQFNVSSDIVAGNGVYLITYDTTNVERSGSVWGKPGNTALLGDYEGATMFVTNTAFNTITEYDTPSNNQDYTFYFYDGGDNIYLGSAGDVNNDGYVDIIAAHAFTTNCSATLVLGSPNLQTGYKVREGNSDGPELYWTQEGMGYSASVGDVNNDGYADFVINAPFTGSAGSKTLNATGQSYLLYGSPTAFADLDGKDLSVDTPKGVLINGLTYPGNLGFYVKALGDVSGDGVDDFIITAPAVYSFFGNQFFPGKAYLIYGSPSYFDKSVAKTLNIETGSWQGATFTASENADLFGVTVNAWDVNGDGRLDLLFGAPGAQGGKGRIYVLYGTSTPWSGNIDVNTYPSLTIFEGNSTLGVGVDVGVGDFNNDGAADVLSGLNSNANVYIYLGALPSPTSSATGTPSISMSGTPAVSASSLSAPPSPSRTALPRFDHRFRMH